VVFGVILEIVHCRSCASTFGWLIDCVFLVLSSVFNVFFGYLFLCFAVKFEVYSLSVLREESVEEAFFEVISGYGLQGVDRLLLFVEIVLVTSDLTPHSCVHFIEINVLFGNDGVDRPFDELKVFLRNLFDSFFDSN
jgi:hypothetical protein